MAQNYHEPQQSNFGTPTQEQGKQGHELTFARPCSQWHFLKLPNRGTQVCPNRLAHMVQDHSVFKRRGVLTHGTTWTKSEDVSQVKCARRNRTRLQEPPSMTSLNSQKQSSMVIARHWGMGRRDQRAIYGGQTFSLGRSEKGPWVEGGAGDPIM